MYVGTGVARFMALSWQKCSGRKPLTSPVLGSARLARAGLTGRRTATATEATILCRVGPSISLLHPAGKNWWRSPKSWPCLKFPAHPAGRADTSINSSD